MNPVVYPAVKDASARGLVLLVLALAGLQGCGGGGVVTLAAPAVSLAGAWTGTAPDGATVVAVISPRDGAFRIMNLLDQSQFSGVMALAGSTLTGSGSLIQPGSGLLSGAVSTDVNGNYVLNVANGSWLVGLQGLPARGYNSLPNQAVTVSNANPVVNFVVQPFSGQTFTITTAVNPPGARSTTGLSTCCLSPATRTSKNSSRLELTMQKNLTRSRRGVEGSSASSSTRWLNSSQLSSRFKN